jgi:chromosomal replication initiator protein
MSDINYEALWKEAVKRIRHEIGDIFFDSWFNARYKSGCDGEIVLAVPSSFYRDNLTSRYAELIRKTLADLAKRSVKVSVVIDDTIDAASKEASSKAASEPPRIEVAPEVAKQERALPQEFMRGYTFENYVVGDNNQFAVNAALAVAKNIGTAYNPLFIYGKVGVGKTHLMQSIGERAFHTAEREVIYVTAESFMNDYSSALRENAMSAFRRKYRQVNLLLIDDIHFLENKPGLQEELFNTFNAMLSANNQMVFTCDRPVSELKHFSERLASRLQSGLAVDIQMPQFETRCAILQKKLAERDAALSDDIIQFVARNIATSVRDLVTALSRLTGYAELTKTPLTLDVARERLADMLPGKAKEPPKAPPPAKTIMANTILRAVSDAYTVAIDDLQSKKRTKNLARARQTAMYLLRDLTSLTTTEIGAIFDRDHSTVLYAISAVEKIDDGPERQLIDDLRHEIIYGK